MHSCRVQLRIESGDGEQNDELYEAIAADREAIHDSLGTKLVWENNPKVRSCRIYGVPEGACGYRSPAHERETGYEVLADAMYRFHETLMLYVERLI